MSQPAAQGGGPHEQSRVAMVTGATSGIGFHTASELAARGASVFITGRDRQRGEDTVRAVFMGTALACCAAKLYVLGGRHCR